MSESFSEYRRGELFKQRMMDKDGDINTLVGDLKKNEYSIEDSSSFTFAKLSGANWDAVDPLYVNKILDNNKVFNASLLTAQDNLDSQDQKTFGEYVELAKNIEKNDPNFFKDLTLTTSPLTAADLGGGSVSVPKDPEGFFIGRYPINQKETDNFDFLKITCYDYEPGLFSGGEQFFKIDDIDKRVKKRKGVVSLPMQPGISESNSVGWGENEINPLQLAGAGVAGAAMSGISNFLTGDTDKEGAAFFGKLGATAQQALSDINPNLIKSFFAGQAVGANIIGRGTGLTINNNLEVLFNGPQLRTFSYNYRFTPREPKEADKIKQIIRFFKKSMAPKRSNSRIFLKSPDVFKLKYTFKNGDSHPFLNNIKICALSGFTVDYTPDGSYSTYEDDGGRGDGSMTSYQVSLGFKELTPIYNDDFWNDDEGKEGTGF